MKTSSFNHTFRAFSNRNYALFFSGQSVSQIGTWMQRTGVNWLVYSITHSPFMLGLSVFASQFPSFLLSLPGGIISDRCDRYKILLVTQTASMLQAILLAALVLTGHHTIFAILALSVVLGIINAFDVPARQPLVHQLVNNKDDLPNALALNSAMVNLARLLGPALSGLVLQHLGAGVCFLINACSFMAVICSLLLMKLPPYQEPITKKKATNQLAEGFQYVRNTPSIGIILLILALTALLVLPYDTLIPVFARTVFNGNAATYGYISSFMGLGAISATLMLASLRKGADLKFVFLFCSIILGIGLLLFSHTVVFPLAMLFAVFCGFGAMAQNTICITLVQVEAAAHMRGRMMSYVALAYFGMLPLGSLLIGTVSEKIGAPDALLCQGIAALIIVTVFSRFFTRDRKRKHNSQQLETAEEMSIENV
ncbi:MAG: MFS transporter [Chitinophagaceae bacterium]